MIRFFIEDTDIDISLLTDVDDWLIKVARQERSDIYQINYIFGSDEYLLSINHQYLQHDYYTDIITFDQRDNPNASIEGDIFISIDRVRENALTLKETFSRELLRVIVHGLLHLLGYSDDDDELKQQMRCLENKYLDFHPNW